MLLARQVARRETVGQAHRAHVGRRVPQKNVYAAAVFAIIALVAAAALGVYWLLEAVKLILQTTLNPPFFPGGFGMF